MKEFVMLSALLLGNPEHVHSAQQFDTLEECKRAIVGWSGQMYLYAQRNRLLVEVRMLERPDTGEPKGVVFVGLGWASCQRTADMNEAARQALESSP